MNTPEFIFPDPSFESENGKKCLFCGGIGLIAGVKLLDRSRNAEGPIKVGKDRDPEAFVFKGRERSETSALVCESCGYVHLFASSPRSLKMVGS